MRYILYPNLLATLENSVDQYDADSLQNYSQVLTPTYLPPPEQ